MKRCLFLIGLVFVSDYSLAETCDSHCKERLVRTYFDHFEVVLRDGSKVEDIDALFQVVHPDVQYEHVEYQADFDFGAWKEAFLSNLQRGSYRNGIEDSIEITKVINGQSHMAVEYGYGKTDKEGHWQPTDNVGLLILFGFKDGKISLVREYW